MADELQRVRTMLPLATPCGYGADGKNYGDNNGGDDGAGAEAVNEGHFDRPPFTQRIRPRTPRSAHGATQGATHGATHGATLTPPGGELRQRNSIGSVDRDRRSPGCGKVRHQQAAGAADRPQRNTPSGRDRTALLGSAKARPRSSRTTATQEALTEDLAAMAKQLRELSTEEGARLKADVALGEMLNDAADRNSENLAKADLTLKEQVSTPSPPQRVCPSLSEYWTRRPFLVYVRALGLMLMFTALCSFAVGC